MVKTHTEPNSRKSVSAKKIGDFGIDCGLGMVTPRLSFYVNQVDVQTLIARA
jgi:hypothetical protein